MEAPAAQRSRRSRRRSGSAAAATAAAAAAVAAAAVAAVLGDSAVGDQVDPTAWNIDVDVRLPKSPHAVTVRLTVHVHIQMTLEWPSFGGLQHGQAIFAKLPNIEALSLDPQATVGTLRQSSGRQPSNQKKSCTKVRWSFARRQVDADLSDDEAPDTLREVAQERTHRDATMEDVHAMVMAMVDQELRDEQNWPRPAETKSLLTLRDSSGAMLVHNLLLAGAQGKDPRAHKLFLEIVHKIPRLLLDVHDGSLIFHGEGPLHVLAVNGRSMDEAEVVEKVLVDCLRTFRRGIAERKISPEELVSPRVWESKKKIKFPHTQGTKPDDAKPVYDQARAQLRTLRLALRQRSAPASTPTLHLNFPPNLSPGEEGSRTGNEGVTTKLRTVRLCQQGRDASDAPAARVRRYWPVLPRCPYDVLWRDTYRLLGSLRHEKLARGAGGRPH